MQTTAISALLQSKKFLAASLASILSGVGLKYGLTLEQVAIVTAPLYGFVGGQAVADFGKERAKIEVRSRSAITFAPQRVVANAPLVTDVPRNPTP